MARRLSRELTRAPPRVMEPLGSVFSVQNVYQDLFCSLPLHSQRSFVKPLLIGLFFMGQTKAPLETISFKMLIST